MCLGGVEGGRGNCSQDIIYERIEKKGSKKKKKETRDLKQVLPWDKWEDVMRKGIVGIRSPDPEALPLVHSDAYEGKT